MSGGASVGGAMSGGASGAMGGGATRALEAVG